MSVDLINEAAEHVVNDGAAMLEGLTAEQRIEWAAKTFNGGLFALTSAGVESALTLDHLAASGHEIPVIHINTGFLPPETVEFRDRLRDEYDLTVYEFGPSEAEVSTAGLKRLWETDLPLYRRITKLDPLQRAIDTLGVTALITGVRGDQNDNRANLDFVARGNDGELRVHPFLDWSQAEVDAYLDDRGLPRNPLHELGHKSLDDVHLMVLGSEEKIECGLNILPDGTVERRAAS